jgi:glycosyltransferase involved in cell wall biosynthesis
VSERLRPPVRNILWHQTELPRLASELGLDALHVPSYRRMVWRRPCGLAATIHDLAPFRVKHKYDWKRMLYGRLVVPRLAERQHEIIAVSQNTANDIATCLRLPRGHVTVIPNGVDHARFFPGSREQARRFTAERFDLREPFFLYVARLEHPAKNHVRLVEAFNRFKAETRSPWQLALGGSDWHGAQTIHDAIRQSRFAQDIRCLGFVADEDLPDLYRAADAFVYPSLYEGFGLPPVEAMACGCPVLCSTRGALGEVVGDAAATVNPEDVAALTRQLVRLATDDGLRAQLRTAGLARAKQFDWMKTAAATLEVYSRAAARVKAPAEEGSALAAPALPGHTRIPAREGA